MGEFLDALFAFLGAGVGSGLVFWASRGRTKVEREARSREEWGRRFAIALERAAASDPTSSEAGQALMEELLRSELANEDDRRQAQRVLDAIAMGGQPDLRLLLTPERLDDVTVVRETGNTSDLPDGEDRS